MDVTNVSSREVRLGTDVTNVSSREVRLGMDVTNVSSREVRLGTDVTNGQTQRRSATALHAAILFEINNSLKGPDMALKL